jgi:hypothetical protein
VLAGIEIAVALRRLNEKDWKIGDYLRLLANAETLDFIRRGDTPEEIVSSWTARLDDFRRARTRALLY